MDIIMKKFIIVIVFVFLIAILISFNYLLWDRQKQLESFQDMSDSNNLTIDALSDKMNTLDKLNKELTQKSEKLTEEITAVQQDSFDKKSENIELKRAIITKNDLIIALKNSINAEPINTVIKKWTEAVDSGNYKGAQTLISKQSTNKNLNDIEKYFKSELKGIRFKSSKIFTEMIDEDHINKIQFKAVFDVDKLDTATKSESTQGLFKSGTNQKFITMELNIDTNQWLILDITDNP
jgi:cell division protein FtsB